MEISKILKKISKYDKILLGLGRYFYTNHQLPELYTNWDEIKKYNVESVNNNYKNSKILSLLDNKDFFIITSSWESKLSDLIISDSLYTPNGDSLKLQCYNACSDKVWNYYDFLNFKDIPTCPNCKSSLIMNIATDAYFLNNYDVQESFYHRWIHKNYNEKILLIEVEVKEDDKKIIRDPFENIASALPNASIIRINSEDIKLPRSIKRKNRIRISPEDFINSI